MQNLQYKIDKLCKNANIEFTDNKNVVSALIDYHRAFDLFEFLDKAYKVQKHEILIRIAICYDILGNFTKTLEYLNSAIEIVHNISCLILYKSVILQTLGKYSESQKTLIKFKQICSSKEYFLYETFKLVFLFTMNLEKEVMIREIDEYLMKYKKTPLILYLKAMVFYNTAFKDKEFEEEINDSRYTASNINTLNQSIYEDKKGNNGVKNNNNNNNNNNNKQSRNIGNIIQEINNNVNNNGNTYKTRSSIKSNYFNNTITRKNQLNSSINKNYNNNNLNSEELKALQQYEDLIREANEIDEIDTNFLIKEGILQNNLTKIFFMTLPEMDFYQPRVLVEYSSYVNGFKIFFTLLRVKEMLKFIVKRKKVMSKFFKIDVVGRLTTSGNISKTHTYIINDDGVIGCEEENIRKERDLINLLNRNTNNITSNTSNNGFVKNGKFSSGEVNVQNDITNEINSSYINIKSLIENTDNKESNCYIKEIKSLNNNISTTNINDTNILNSSILQQIKFKVNYSSYSQSIIKEATEPSNNNNKNNTIKLNSLFLEELSKISNSIFIINLQKIIKLKETKATELYSFFNNSINLFNWNSLLKKKLIEQKMLLKELTSRNLSAYYSFNYFLYVCLEEKTKDNYHSNMLVNNDNNTNMDSSLMNIDVNFFIRKKYYSKYNFKVLSLMNQVKGGCNCQIGNNESKECENCNNADINNNKNKLFVCYNCISSIEDDNLTDKNNTYEFTCFYCKNRFKADINNKNNDIKLNKEVIKPEHSITLSSVNNEEIDVTSNNLLRKQNYVDNNIKDVKKIINNIDRDSFDKLLDKSEMELTNFNENMKKNNIDKENFHYNIENTQITKNKENNKNNHNKNAENEANNDLSNIKYHNESNFINRIINSKSKKDTDVLNYNKNNKLKKEVDNYNSHDTHGEMRQYANNTNKQNSSKITKENKVQIQNSKLSVAAPINNKSNNIGRNININQQHTKNSSNIKTKSLLNQTLSKKQSVGREEDIIREGLFHPITNKDKDMFGLYLNNKNRVGNNRNSSNKNLSKEKIVNYYNTTENQNVKYKNTYSSNIEGSVKETKERIINNNNNNNKKIKTNSTNSNNNSNNINNTSNEANSKRLVNVISADNFNTNSKNIYISNREEENNVLKNKSNTTVKANPVVRNVNNNNISNKGRQTNNNNVSKKQNITYANFTLTTANTKVLNTNTNLTSSYNNILFTDTTNKTSQININSNTNLPSLMSDRLVNNINTNTNINFNSNVKKNTGNKENTINPSSRVMSPTNSNNINKNLKSKNSNNNYNNNVTCKERYSTSKTSSNKQLKQTVDMKPTNNKINSNNNNIKADIKADSINPHIKYSNKRNSPHLLLPSNTHFGYSSNDNFFNKSIAKTKDIISLTHNNDKNNVNNFTVRVNNISSNNCNESCNNNSSINNNANISTTKRVISLSPKQSIDNMIETNSNANNSKALINLKKSNNIKIGNTTVTTTTNKNNNISIQNSNLNNKKSISNNINIPENCSNINITPNTKQVNVKRNNINNDKANTSNNINTNITKNLIDIKAKAAVNNTNNNTKTNKNAYKLNKPEIKLSFSSSNKHLLSNNSLNNNNNKLNKPNNSLNKNLKNISNINNTGLTECSSTKDMFYNPLANKHNNNSNNENNNNITNNTSNFSNFSHFNSKFKNKNKQLSKFNNYSNSLSHLVNNSNSNLINNNNVKINSSPNNTTLNNNYINYSNNNNKNINNSNIVNTEINETSSGKTMSKINKNLGFLVSPRLLINKSNNNNTTNK